VYKVVGSGGLCPCEMRGGEGFGPKTCNRAPMAWLWAEMGLREVEGGAVGLQAPSHANLGSGDGE
jgi:hypothetical protein